MLKQGGEPPNVGEMDSEAHREAWVGLNRVLHAAEPWKDPPLGWGGRLHQGAVGRRQRRGATVPQSRLVVGAWAEHAWPLSYPPPPSEDAAAGWVGGGEPGLLRAGSGASSD